MTREISSIFRFIAVAFCLALSGTLFAEGLTFKPILPAVVEAKPAKKGGPIVPLTKDQERSNAQARIELQAIDELKKGDHNAALKKYATLAKTYSGNRQGGAFDLRILEIHRGVNRKNDIPGSFQKALISTFEKYKDENILGKGNAPLAKRIQATAAKMHRDLVTRQVALGLGKKSSLPVRKTAIATIDTYLEGEVAAPEKERLRAQKGEIQFLSDNHIAAAVTFSALATENKAKAGEYWRQAIRSQLILASWPAEAPWDGAPAAGKPAPRETLRGMYANITRDGDWATVSHIGLLDQNLGRQAEAFKLFNDTLAKNPKGPHAQRAAGLMASSFIQSKSWPEEESLARLMLKQGIIGLHLKNTYKARDLLGQALLEGGLERYTSADYKTSIAKLNEFVTGWRDHSRHDQGFYQLAFAHHEAKNYRTALETMVNFTKSYTKTKYRRDALANGGAWASALAWEDHVMYFLEAHVGEFPRDSQTPASLETLVNLYLGREHYDAASRIMEIQLSNPQITADAKYDVARRLIDVHERNGSRESSLRVAEMVLKRFSTQPAITASALSLKARMVASGGIAKLQPIATQLASLDASDRYVAEAQSEVQFLMGESLSKGAFEEELFSLASRNPLSDLNASYTKYERIRQVYEAACANAGSSWCGPAMHRLARVSEKYSAIIVPLTIPRTLDPADVKAFDARKKSIAETVDNRVLAFDERSMSEAKAGATNPDWTAAILWQNASDWQSERVTGETGSGYIQWHAASSM